MGNVVKRQIFFFKKKRSLCTAQFNDDQYNMERPARRWLVIFNKLYAKKRILDSYMQIFICNWEKRKQCVQNII